MSDDGEMKDVALEIKDATDKTKDVALDDSKTNEPTGDWKHSSHENDFQAMYGEHERNMVGYGATPITPRWPRSAKVAINFVINYEEGGETCTLHGDNASEHRISDLGPGAKSYPNKRNLNMESMYDYGSRCGFWRLHRIFTSRKVPVTVWGVGMALERNMEIVGAIKQQRDWEVSSHGYRWWDYTDVPEEVEKEHIDRAVKIHQTLFGKHPAGLYHGKPSMNTRRLAVEEGGFLYDSDAYNDDLPYWSFEHGEEGQPHLVIPYSLVENDMLFTEPNGWAQPDDFVKHLKRTLDFLVLEGRGGQPKMMSVGLHCRLSRPARASAIAEFVDYAKSYGREVWITTRESIANHWYENHLPRGCGSPILSMTERSGGGGFGGGGFGSSSSGGGGGAPRNTPSRSKSGDTPSSSSYNKSYGPQSEVVSPASKFSFLGNLKAPRDSEEYKQSLKTSTTNEESEEPKEEEADCI